jgi:hypothetical protein
MPSQVYQRIVSWLMTLFFVAIPFIWLKITFFLKSISFVYSSLYIDSVKVWSVASFNHLIIVRKGNVLKFSKSLHLTFIVDSARAKAHLCTKLFTCPVYSEEAPEFHVASAGLFCK